MQEKANSIIEAIIIVTAIFTLVGGFLVSFILYFNKRKNKFYQEKKEMENLFSSELLKTQFEAREETLNQVGEELHDNIGQLLSSTKLLLGITERSLHQVPDTLRTAEETLGKAIHDIRSLSKSLNREWLDQFNLIENLETEINRINQGQLIHIRLSYTKDILLLDANTQVILFRIIQEAMHNAIKHAEAEQIIIDILSDGSQHHIEIMDDGKGFSMDGKPHPGVGLLNIEKRTKLIGGNLQISSAPTQGTHVLITVPHQNSSL
jgi:signal transduction histidine kinase